ncbi:MAG TPA: hypothetical protein VMV29_11980 [Ktedonobacterales bacterium]|nr:hypothetical protein [Ktedonobacterales bacterium]
MTRMTTRTTATERPTTTDRRRWPRAIGACLFACSVVSALYPIAEVVTAQIAPGSARQTMTTPQ